MEYKGKTNRRHCLIIICLVSAYLAMASTAFAQSDTFTYQGRLTDGGSPANGNYDIEFRLFDTLTVGTGTQIGPTAIVPNVAVFAGIFTVHLDLMGCTTCFNGLNRFLQIAVRPAGGSTFTTLSPRQPITSTPYAMRSRTAARADGLLVACVSCVKAFITSIEYRQRFGP
jgi:hypothetical protein